MKRQIQTHTFFNLGTQRALLDRQNGYVSKDIYILEHIKQIKRQYNLNRIYRFDLGQNNDGCDINVAKYLGKSLHQSGKRIYIKNYPEFICRKLREKIASLHGISAEWVILSAGLDQMLIMIASSFLELSDRILVNSPSFYLFEDYSKRMGAIPIKLHLYEKDNFSWTAETFKEYVDILDKLKPKLIWLANPNNPTGVKIPQKFLEPIIMEAANHYTFVVMDEAYGEYIDGINGTRSASSFLKDYNNLIVLRTFSKAFGLANLRIAYAMSGDNDILNALQIHRPYFPITQISFDSACAALKNIQYMEIVRKKIAKRKKFLINGLSTIPHMIYIDSDSSIMMIAYKLFSAQQLIQFLETYGIIVASVPGEDEISKKYIRITLGRIKELDYLLQALRKLSASI